MIQPRCSCLLSAVADGCKGISTETNIADLFENIAKALTPTSSLEHVLQTCVASICNIPDDTDEDIIDVVMLCAVGALDVMQTMALQSFGKASLKVRPRPGVPMPTWYRSGKDALSWTSTVVADSRLVSMISNSMVNNFMRIIQPLPDARSAPFVFCLNNETVELCMKRVMGDVLTLVETARKEHGFTGEPSPNSKASRSNISSLTEVRSHCTRSKVLCSKHI